MGDNFILLNILAQSERLGTTPAVWPLIFSSWFLTGVNSAIASLSMPQALHGTPFLLRRHILGVLTLTFSYNLFTPCPTLPPVPSFRNYVFLALISEQYLPTFSLSLLLHSFLWIPWSWYKICAETFNKACIHSVCHVTPDYPSKLILDSFPTDTL